MTRFSRSMITLPMPTGTKRSGGRISAYNSMLTALLRRLAQTLSISKMCRRCQTPKAEVQRSVSERCAWDEAQELSKHYEEARQARGRLEEAEEVDEVVKAMELSRNETYMSPEDLERMKENMPSETESCMSPADPDADDKAVAEPLKKKHRLYSKQTVEKIQQPLEKIPQHVGVRMSEFAAPLFGVTARTFRRLKNSHSPLVLVHLLWFIRRT